MLMERFASSLMKSFYLQSTRELINSGKKPFWEEINSALFQKLSLENNIKN